jgi:NAD(P)-dependent dehydrogenase (short-subunit alcohol dehydrogenase family)
MALLSGKIALITAAASGIGAAAARTFVREGARVVLLDIAPAPLEALANELGGDAAWLVGDVAEAETNAAAVDLAKSRFGGLNVALLNVGVTGIMAPIADTPVDSFDATMRTNVRGAFLGLQHALPAIAANGGGSIVVTASTAGFRAGAPGRYAYVTSKHAVVGLTRAAAAEGAAKKVRVNSISPGGVDTPMTASLAAVIGEEAARQALQAFARSIPLGRLAEPDEIADAMLFFASDLSRYCTGTNLMVDGGMMG